MAMPNPDKIAFERVLKSVKQLSPNEQAQLIKEIEHQELLREIIIGVEQLNRGEKIPGKQVFQELRERHKSRISNNK